MHSYLAWSTTNSFKITSTSTSSKVLSLSGFSLWQRIVIVFSFCVNDELPELDEVFPDELDLRGIFGVLWLPMLKRLDILRSRVVLKLSFGLKWVNVTNDTNVNQLPFIWLWILFRYKILIHGWKMYLCVINWLLEPDRKRVPLLPFNLPLISQSKLYWLAELLKGKWQSLLFLLTFNDPNLAWYTFDKFDVSLLGDVLFWKKNW